MHTGIHGHPGLANAGTATRGPDGRVHTRRPHARGGDGGNMRTRGSCSLVASACPAACMPSVPTAGLSNRPCICTRTPTESQPRPCSARVERGGTGGMGGTVAATLAAAAAATIAASKIAAAVATDPPQSTPNPEPDTAPATAVDDASWRGGGASRKAWVPSVPLNTTQSESKTETCTADPDTASASATEPASIPAGIM
jgi:hypothetical protein